jgi:hypothetical protein
MKDPNCNLCNPRKKDWESSGFYGYSCTECIVPNRAFIILDEHRGELTEEEQKTFEELVKKHYPQLKSKRLSESRKTCLHWYEFLVGK